MKVDNPLNMPLVKDVAQKGVQKASQAVESAVGNPVREFNDVAGDAVGRAKLSIDGKIADLSQIRSDIEKTLQERHFCKKTIDYIIAFLKPENANSLHTLAHDPYACSRDMCDFACFATKENSAFLEHAANMRDYTAAQDVKRGLRKSLSEVKDLRQHVEENLVPYNPKWNAKALALSGEEIIKAKQEVEANLKNRGISEKTITYVKSWIRDDSVDVIRLASQDKNIEEHDMCLWACHANAENADLLIRALLTKQYSLESDINWGQIRKLETVDSWYAYKNMIKNGKMKIDNYEQANFMYKTFEQKINDKFSDFLQLIFEDNSLSADFLTKVCKNLTKENKDALKMAYLKKDFATMEKICGEKFDPRDVGFVKNNVKTEFKTTFSTGKISRDDFVKYMDDKLAHIEKYDEEALNDAEVRNLAKLFDTTEEQIRNMDKKEYRRLCIKTHPDRNPNDKMATQVFRILNKIFLSQQ